jgi:hypothetical protein
MKINNKIDVQQIVNQIESGECNRIILKSLLIDIRDLLSSSDPIREIAHFIAHPTRDKGTTYRHFENFIELFLVAVKAGGKFEVKPVFTRKEIIEKLTDDLVLLDIDVNRSELLLQKDKVIECIKDIVEDTEIKIRNPSILSAMISNSNGELVFSFTVDSNFKGNIRFYDNVSIAVPIFD